MKNLTFEQFLQSDLKNHTNYYLCGAKKEYFSKDSDGSWFKFTYDKNGNCRKYEDSTGFWNKRTYDQKGNELTFENSYGNWSERTYDQNGNEKTYEDSDGIKRGFENTHSTLEQEKDGFTYDESNKIYYKYDYIKN